MKLLLVILAVVVVAHLMLVGLAVGEGFLLHWAVPSMDFSLAVLVGLAATVATIHLLSQFVRIAMHFPPSEATEKDDEDEDEDEENEENEEDEEPPTRIPEFHFPLPRLSRRRRRRRRSR